MTELIIDSPYDSSTDLPTDYTQFKYDQSGGKKNRYIHRTPINKVSSRYCENSIIENNTEYKLEKIWRRSKNDLSRDSKGSLYPYPVEGSAKEPESVDIVNRLHVVNAYLDSKKKYELYDEPRDCLLCDKKAVTTKRYVHDKVMWEDGLIHYITAHMVGLSGQFKHFILNDDAIRSVIARARDGTKLTPDSKKKVTRLSRVTKDNNEYVILERNQILIMDALMIHGGYAKKYIDVEQNFSRYSEHAGFLDFEGNTLSKIVVSGKTNRVDEGDEEIYLPMGMDDMFDYEYIFHTHPPTPKPGGRAKEGILYEFPSIGDIYHFIDHHNEGNVIGSLVLASEGLYNIRKATSNPDDIEVDEDDLYKRYQRVFNKLQKDSIEEYGTDFDTRTFYSTIAQNTQYIDKMNQILNNFNIHIDYYPRKKDSEGRWVIDTVFLVFRQNKPKK
ncbi:hypothetical protein YASMINEVIRUS_556 [Yasminevirus sp. GU-2018]|uniref:Uncharacterized protein n=1 Tax=Yasminevirus sp. GU-2018 TaxID=2420051 RepID=A0A5K0U9L4_9VIRU|nr:hypothetical protein YASMINEVIRUS_556 [Yasminevirus sp. GU-2018]